MKRIGKEAVSQPRFEFSTSRIKVSSFTASLACSVTTSVSEQPVAVIFRVGACELLPPHKDFL
jgi:hypothetical protein